MSDRVTIVRAIKKDFPYLNSGELFRTVMKDQMNTSRKVKKNERKQGAIEELNFQIRDLYKDLRGLELIGSLYPSPYIEGKINYIRDKIEELQKHLKELESVEK